MTPLDKNLKKINFTVQAQIDDENTYTEEWGSRQRVKFLSEDTQASKDKIIEILLSLFWQYYYRNPERDLSPSYFYCNQKKIIEDFLSETKEIISEMIHQNLFDQNVTFDDLANYAGKTIRISEPTTSPTTSYCPEFIYSPKSDNN